MPHPASAPPPAQAALLATERWAWLDAFVRTWYAEPLHAGDGATPAEIAAAERRVGCALPPVLTEWFTLVGRRLEPVLDHPAVPSELDTVDTERGGALAVWADPGYWAIVLDHADPGEDPACVLTEPDPGLGPDSWPDGAYAFGPAPLSGVLRSMLVAYTVTGASFGDEGPLGRLAAYVRGGMILEPSHEETRAVRAAYAPLPLVAHPCDGGAEPRGDADTVVRTGRPLLWMARGDDAYARFDAVVPLEPEGGSYEVLLAFDGLAPEERALLVDAEGLPDDSPYTRAAGASARLEWTVATSDAVRIAFTGTAPDATAAALLAAVPAALTGRAVVAVRPERVHAYRMPHPERRSRYTPIPLD